MVDAEKPSPARRKPVAATLTPELRRPPTITKNDSTGAGHGAHRIRRATSAAPRQWIKTTIAPAGNPREKARRKVTGTTGRLV